MLKRILFTRARPLLAVLAIAALPAAIAQVVRADDAAGKKYVRQGILCSSSPAQLNARLTDPEVSLGYYAGNTYIKGPYTLSSPVVLNGEACYLITGL